MKRAIIIAGALVLSLGGIAGAESLTEKTGVNAVLGVAPKTSDFVYEAAMSGMFEIQSSQLAKKQSSGSMLRFADQMITDHGKIAAQLKGLVQDNPVNATLPAVLDDADQKKLDHLKSLSGAAFASAYADDQVAGHKDAVNLFERYSKGGDSEALKQWASKTLPTLREHLRMAQNLQSDRPLTQ